MSKVNPDLNPEYWRRCRTCGNKLVRVANDFGWTQNLRDHPGHEFVPAQGFHFWEWVKYLLGWYD